MRGFSFSISRYVLQAILPYFAVTWLLLSVILFVQQASRFSDLLFNTSLPSSLLWQLTIALIPTVISFTCPIAVLVGVIIGLSRMQGDSEMVAIRAAGVGNLQITSSVLLLGIVLSLFAVFINLEGVPFAAQIVRRVGLQAALYKLESPIEPGVFNAEIQGFTIYVKKGNLEKGTWESIFIHQEDKDLGKTRLITAKEGRIDSKEEDSEIVLANASVTTFETGKERKIVSESVKDLRLVVKTKRGELIDKLTKTKTTPEEMGLAELGRHAQTLDGIKQVEARILWQRRVLLSITPLLFALLGAGLVTKFNRGGRGFGIFLALVSLVAYYLLALMGEQLARTGAIGVVTSGLIPFIAILGVTAWLFVSQRFFITRTLSISSYLGKAETTERSPKMSSKNSYIDLTTGILDFDLIWNLVRNYLLTVGFLISIYFIFTAFERWKFAGAIDNGLVLLGSYLFFLTPFVYIEIAPSALMIATLVTYIIKSRQNEIVTWTAAGRSVYRLMLPCFILMVAVGTLNFGIQEWILTETNRKQDALLDQLR
ncbi:MAG: LptF/LptG family permease, partial [Pyrinomonadaceae bacterium]|nr:LptF/LptG family permease [Pyrinomonadaceae bacterium]